MSTIMPKEKKIQDALKWISENRQFKKIEDLIKEAIFKYNLDPKQEEYLRRLFKEDETNKN